MQNIGKGGYEGTVLKWCKEVVQVREKCWVLRLLMAEQGEITDKEEDDDAYEDGDGDDHDDDYGNDRVYRFINDNNGNKGC